MAKITGMRERIHQPLYDSAVGQIGRTTTMQELNKVFCMTSSANVTVESTRIIDSNDVWGQAQARAIASYMRSKEPKESRPSRWFVRAPKAGPCVLCGNIADSYVTGVAPGTFGSEAEGGDRIWWHMDCHAREYPPSDAAFVTFDLWGAWKNPTTSPTSPGRVRFAPRVGLTVVDALFDVDTRSHRPWGKGPAPMRGRDLAEAMIAREQNVTVLEWRHARKLRSSRERAKQQRARQ